MLINVNSTVQAASRALVDDQQDVFDNTPSAPNVLCRTTAGAIESSYCNVPFQVYYKVNAVSTVDLTVRFVEIILSNFHIQTITHHLAAYLESFWETDEGNDVLDLQTLTETDLTYIKNLNAIPQGKDFRTIHECIAQSTAEDPQSIAVDAWDRRLTRGELQAESQKLAELLIESKVGRGDVVGILMNKSAWVPVSMLAILKAGGAILLLEPSLPQERLKVMAEKTKIHHAICMQKHISLALSLVPTVLANDGYGHLAIVDGKSRIASTCELPNVHPEDVAFCIFTSGSSGIPKAVVTRHFQWVTGCTRHIQTFGITDGTRVFQYSSYSFVVSLLDQLSALMVGGVVCIPSPEERLNDLDNAIRRLRPDYICLTPSVAKLIDPSRVPSLKTLVLVGEPIQSSLIDRWLGSGNATVRNGYGQSEACGMNSTAVLSPSSGTHRSIGNSTWLRYWIVDPWNHHRLMPVGGLGKLVVEGYSIAQGYLQDPEKTASAYIESPEWASEFGAGSDGRRWYKTGDLVQYQQSGELFLFGRKDAQIKVNGQRVEAAEIEHHILKKLPEELSQVIVDKIAIREGGDMLVAFVVLRNNSWTTGIESQNREQQLQRIMIDRLQMIIPLWMIPPQVVIVSTMPKTATGKLDRRALRNTNIMRNNHGAGSKEFDGDEGNHEDPTSESYITLRQTFSRILKTDEKHIHPDSRWLDLGGDSLSAMIDVRDARRAGLDISIADIMSDATLIELSRCAGQAPDSTQLTNGHMESATKQEAPLTDFQMQYLTAIDPGSTGMMYKYSLRFRSDFNLQRVQTALRTWIESIDSLRITFSSQQPTGMIQKVVQQDDIYWKRFLLTHASDAELSGQLQGHDFQRQPIFVSTRDTALGPGNDIVEVIIQISHSIFDGLSLNLLLDDLVSAYTSGRTPPRPSFLDYLQKHLLARSPESLQYWRNLLRSSSPTQLRVSTQQTRELQHDTTSPPRIRTSSRVIHLPDGPRPASMSTIVQAAWSLVLSVLSGHESVIFLSLMHGRDENIPHSEQIIGCCVNEFPLVVQCTDDMTAMELLRRVNTQVRESDPHAHLGARTIARECTDWPFRDEWYLHSSAVLHQMLPFKDHLPIADLGYLDVGEPSVEHSWPVDFDVLTTSSDSGHLAVELTCQEKVYSRDELDAVSEAFTIGVRELLVDGTTLAAIAHKMRGVPHLPIVTL